MHLSTDVAILGGGLAGLTLAIQLKNTMPELRISVVEERNQPAPERAFKVGESMVEVSSWYLNKVLCIGDHLFESHLPKFGLRFFINGNNNLEFGERPEYGLMNVPEQIKNLNSPIPGIHLSTFNIDRGRLENFLEKKCSDNNIELLFGFKIKSIESGNPHKVGLKSSGRDYLLTSQWVIDATGRSGFLSRKMDSIKLADHRVNSVWFRLEGRINPDNFSNNIKFKERAAPNLRWRSTNHFMGYGYWVWLIPLPDDATSVGIMIDPSIHKISDINRYELAIEWLQKRENSLSVAISQCKLIDFKSLKSQAYLNKQLFSKDRWALTGESALFSDALYSPGGDFIAVINTLITNIIKADRSSNRAELSLNIKFGEQLVQGMFKHYMGLYQNSYKLMGNAEAMIQKVAWDTAVYFGYNVLLFRNSRFCDPRFHQEIKEENARLDLLQKKMILVLNDYTKHEHSKDLVGEFYDQSLIESVHNLYLSSEHELKDSDLKVQLKKNLDTLEEFAVTIANLVAY